MAGIIKGILMLEKGLIPPNANFEKLNPKINAKLYNVKVSSKVYYGTYYQVLYIQMDSN